MVQLVETNRRPTQRGEGGTHPLVVRIAVSKILPSRVASIDLAMFLALGARLVLQFLARRIATNLNPMGIVDEAVEDAVCKRRITNVFVPA
jgi:hypothetical protein